MSLTSLAEALEDSALRARVRAAAIIAATQRVYTNGGEDAFANAVLMDADGYSREFCLAVLSCESIIDSLPEPTDEQIMAALEARWDGVGKRMLPEQTVEPEAVTAPGGVAEVLDFG